MTQAQTPPTLLVVDDMAENIEILNDILERDYRIKVATQGERALSIVMSEQPPDLILLDIMMPGMDGFEVCRRIKAQPQRCTIPILFVTAMEDQDDEARGLALGAADYISKPFSPAIVQARVRTHLALQGSRLQLLACLGRAAALRDHANGLHVTRMAHYAQRIALAAGLPADQAEMLLQAAPLHDIGMVTTPDLVLHKPGPLDAAERAQMQQHTAVGARILGAHTDPLLAMARAIAASHHEKWDGSGYPQGLSGTAIPLEARIVAIADVFDTLTSARPYKSAWEVERACQTLVQGSGHFDPELVAAFLRALPGILEVKARYADAAGHAP